MSTKQGLTLFALLFTGVAGLSWWGIHKEEKPATPTHHVALELKVPTEFRFVAFGDTRFHDPSDTQPANPEVRRALVAAIDQEHPAFVSIGGDIVYSGDNANDWAVWDTETKTWRDHSIAVYPALGNHDLKGDLNTALGNYFTRFPQLENSRFYSVHMGHSLMLILDSSLDETTGSQGDWLRDQLGALPAGMDFVFLVFHHPPYTSSSDEKTYGGGHSARAPERALAKMLEEKQQHLRARLIVFSGHVHNYERHEHNGVTYFVTGGGGARPYIIPRAPGDLYKDAGVNYHYLLVQVRANSVEITMNKLELKDGKEVWTRPDSVTLTPPALVPAGAR
ncbi:MAG: metallophosphoesterase, partial [Candidatus Acidiferrum sp.]